MRVGVLSKLGQINISLLTSDNRIFFLIDTKLWVVYPDILMPSRTVRIASNFSSWCYPFVFKILGSCESSFTKQLLIFDSMTLRTVPEKMRFPASAGGSTCEFMNLLVLYLSQRVFYVFWSLRC